MIRGLEKLLEFYVIEEYSLHSSQVNREPQSKVHCSLFELNLRWISIMRVCSDRLIRIMMKLLSSW